MNWKQWQRGLLVSCITGLFSGLIGIAIGITWQQALLLIGGTIAKDALLYMKQHPVDSIQDTAFIYKPLSEKLPIISDNIPLKGPDQTFYEKPQTTENQNKP